MSRGLIVLCAAATAGACATGSAASEHGREPAAVAPATDMRHAVFRPRFVTTEGTFRAGTAFVVAGVPGHGPLMLTVHHVFGRAGGMSREYRWDELASAVREVTARNPWDRALVVRAGTSVPIRGARGMSQSGVSGDLAVFRVGPGSRAGSLRLATQPPRLGERVWLVGPVIGRPRQQWRHPARIKLLAKDGIAYVFDSRIELRGTSGAPVVNAAGEVVAMNLGGGVTKDGALLGVGNASWVVLAKLRAAAAGD